MSSEPEKLKLWESVKADAFSLPNLLSYFRLVLIPIFVVFYIGGEYLQAVLTLAASGVSDFLDGRVARKFDMVTELGKVLDPLADKLTQCAMIICVASRFPAMWLLLAVHILKELVMLGMGWYVLKKTERVNSAKWYGKLCTGVIYAVMMLHVIWPEMPLNLSDALIILCGGLIIMSLCMYALRYAKILRKKDAA